MAMMATKMTALAIFLAQRCNAFSPQRCFEGRAAAGAALSARRDGASRFNVDATDSYEPTVSGGCIRNLENHIRLLDRSLGKSRKEGGMFDWIRERQATGSSGGEDDNNDGTATSASGTIDSAQGLDADTRFGVLSHGTQPDPVYNYGNEASLQLFDYTIEELCRTASRFSTVPELMEDRSNLIEDIETRGYGYIDDAIRISAKGNLFRIDRILVWTVFNDDDLRIGLAAIYDRDGVSPYEDDGSCYATGRVE